MTVPEICDEIEDRLPCYKVLCDHTYPPYQNKYIVYDPDDKPVEKTHITVTKYTSSHPYKLAINTPNTGRLYTIKSNYLQDIIDEIVEYMEDC